MNIPEELIGEILSLLTVKSLMRMKCINKSWNTLISDPIFVKLHLLRSPRNTHFIVYSSRSANILPISVSHLLKSREYTVTLTDDPYRRFHSKDLSRIISSCNGLICLLDCISNKTSDYIYEYSLYFWNPATRTKSEKLGYIRHIRAQFAFGYDNLTDTYKVVMLNLESNKNPVRTTVKVFTLGENVWRDIDCFPVVLADCFPNYLDSHDGVYFRNSIDWLVYHEYNCHLKNLTIQEYVIVSLDLGTETYSQLSLPPCCNEYLLDNTSSTTSTSAALFASMDCLCFSYDFEKTYFVIWKMKEFGIEESWTQFLKISYLDLNTHISEYYSMRLIPLCLSDDDALIFVNNIGDDPTLYDWRKNRVKTIKSINSVCWYNAQEYNVESLVSTC